MFSSGTQQLDEVERVGRRECPPAAAARARGAKRRLAGPGASSRYLWFAIKSLNGHGFLRVVRVVTCSVPARPNPRNGAMRQRDGHGSSLRHGGTGAGQERGALAISADADDMSKVCSWHGSCDSSERVPVGPGFCGPGATGHTFAKTSVPSGAARSSTAVGGRPEPFEPSRRPAAGCCLRRPASRASANRRARPGGRSRRTAEPRLCAAGRAGPNRAFLGRGTRGREAAGRAGTGPSSPPPGWTRIARFRFRTEETLRTKEKGNRILLFGV